MRLRGRCLGSLPTVLMLVATRSPVTNGDCPWSGTTEAEKGSKHYWGGTLPPRLSPILSRPYNLNSEHQQASLGSPSSPLGLPECTGSPGLTTHGNHD